MLLHTGEDAVKEFAGAYLRITGPARVVRGREVKARRDIRQFIWEAQKSEVWRVPGAAVWTCYDAESDSSFYGLGVVLPPVGVTEDDVTVRIE